MKPLRSFQRIAAIADKEWIHIRRDLRSLLLSLLVPTVLVLLFGYALSVDVHSIQMGILDQDNSSVSRQYIEAFSHNEYLIPAIRTRSVNQIDSLLEKRDVSVVLVIPPGFGKKYKVGKQVQVQLLLDGSDSTSAIITLGYMKAITLSFQQHMTVKGLKKVGIQTIGMPVEVSPRVWYNSELKSKNFIIPGLIALILSIISALITSLTISREWERGTMESLITTPLRSHEIILGKLFPYLIIGMFNVIAAISIGYFVFDVPFRGSILLLCIVSFIFLTGTSGLGVLISATTRVQVLSIQFAMVITYMPTLILSDFIFPVKNMPVFIQGISHVIPAKYLIYILKAIALKGLGFSYIITQLLFLSLFSTLIIILAIRKFKIELPSQ